MPSRMSAILYPQGEPASRSGHLLGCVLGNNAGMLYHATLEPVLSSTSQEMT